MNGSGELGTVSKFKGIDDRLGHMDDRKLQICMFLPTRKGQVIRRIWIHEKS